MADDLRQWLESLDLGKYADLFSENEVGLRDLPHITEEDLRDLGLPLGPRRRLLANIGALGQVKSDIPEAVPDNHGRERFWQGTSLAKAECRWMGPFRNFSAEYRLPPRFRRLHLRQPTMTPRGRKGEL